MYARVWKSNWWSGVASIVPAQSQVAPWLRPLFTETYTGHNPCGKIEPLEKCSFVYVLVQVHSNGSA